jgi:predicted GH43/DUF377 family glycosyl hydrolase
MVLKKQPKKKIVKKINPNKKAKVLKIVKKVTKKTPSKRVLSKKKIILKKPKKLVKKIKVTPKKTKVLDRNKKIFKKEVNGLRLVRSLRNPILEPRNYSWESQAAFNPAAISLNGKVHLFYRALGEDGVSRIGYASSYDGINFNERLSYPVYSLKDVEKTKDHWPFTSPVLPSYNKNIYASGGGWGGCEDPRAVLIDGNIYITFNIFNISNGWRWDSLSVAVISITEENLLKRKWIWDNFSYLSQPGDRQKNWVLFPEKINGKFVIFNNLDKGDPNSVFITYVNKLDTSETPTVKDAPDPQVLPDHIVAWHKRTRSVACPPIKTKDGWLLLYHAMDKDNDNRYKLGAMLLDLKDPSKVLYRAQHPILEPEEWYENDWKPGIIYANGAVVKDNKLYVYYGGGDKYIGVASVILSDLINSMKENSSIKLQKNKKINIK